MIKIIEGNLELKKDMKFDDSIEVHGNIICRDGKKNLTLTGDIKAGDILARNINAWDIDARDINAMEIDAGDINARDINAMDINARDIDARNIDAWNINAWDIDARNIDAGNIVCISRKKKSHENKTIAYSIVLDRFNKERKEVMPEALKKKE
jgi:hypothetical protein